MDKELSLRMAAIAGFEKFFTLEHSSVFYPKFITLFLGYMKRFSNDKEEYKIKSL